jgi:hypothetical protein
LTILAAALYLVTTSGCMRSTEEGGSRLRCRI